MPSMVFAEASWYGSIRAGVQDDANSGLADRGSRWGIRGSAEASEGLTAVYQYERKINSSAAEDTGGRLSYVGLSGGFGSITVGQVWNAAYNSVGAITDNSGAFGDSETGYRVGHALSYAVSVGNVSLQADVIMNKGGGMSETILNVTDTNAPSLDDDGDANTTKAKKSEKKTMDAYEIGVTLNNVMESGKIAVAHKSHDMHKGDKKSSNLIAAEYTVGGMTLHLGAAQHKSTMGSYCVITTAGTTLGTRKDNCMDGKKTDSTVFFGARGGLGDTGVSYLLQVRSKKTKGNEADLDTTAAVDSNADAAVLDGQALATNKHSPWVLGLSRSLGGGASVHFEHGNKDQKGKDNNTALWLKVDF